jgi:DNA processing protein
MWKKAQRIEEATLKKRVDIITPEHPDYPALLYGTYARPMVLYIKGSLGCLKDSLPIAMVGTRYCSEYGERTAREVTTELVHAGCVIVSGLAHGIDSVCHTAAIEAGGYTIGVMGCGMDVDYPTGSSPLKTLMKHRGAVVTEYPLGYEPRKHTFPIRNRVIAGMSRGTVVVEAPERSGALITARLALDAGRDVFAVPGDIYSKGYGGVHKLLKDGGAKLIATAADILEEYPGYNARIVPKVNQRMNKTPPAGTAILLKPGLPGGTPESLRLIYEHIDEKPKTADIIADKASQGIGDVMSALTELEIMGIVKSHPGGLFSVNGVT